MRGEGGSGYCHNCRAAPSSSESLWQQGCSQRPAGNGQLGDEDASRCLVVTLDAMPEADNSLSPEVRVQAVKSSQGPTLGHQ